MNKEPIELAARTPTRDSQSSAERIDTSDHGVDSDDVQQLELEQARKALRRHQIVLVIAGFLMNFNVFGINLSYGIFQEYYTSSQTHLLDSRNQDALISLVGAIGSGLTWAGGIAISPMMSRVSHVQWLTVSGVVIMSVGLFLVSLSTRIWHLFLTQTILFGLGSSLFYFPIISIAPLYFDKNRGLAMGIILSGSGIGGLVYAPVLRTLLDQVGAQWTFRIVGLWNLIIGVPIALAVKYRLGYTPQGRTRLNWDLVKRGTFINQASAAFLQAAGNLVPMYYLTSYSTSVLSYPKSLAASLLATNNAVNSISRISMGFIADHLGRQNTMLFSVLLSALSVLTLWYDAPSARFIAFVVMYGIYAGGYNALLPTTIAEVYGVQHYASVNGSIYFIRGLGSMVGAPLAGLILGTYNRSAAVGGGEVDLGLRSRYKEVVIYDGVLLLVAAMAVANVRWYDAKAKGKWSWRA